MKRCFQCDDPTAIDLMHRRGGKPETTPCCGSRECAEFIVKDSTCASLLGCQNKVVVDHAFKMLTDTLSEGMWFMMCSARCYNVMKTALLGTPDTHLVQACGRCGVSQIDPTEESRYQVTEKNVLMCKDCYALQ